MRIARRAYRTLKEGMRTVSSIVEKTAHVYSLAQPLLQQSFDTRGMDDGLMAAYAGYQQSRDFAHQLDAILTN
jgi:hypothetical protein